MIEDALFTAHEFAGLHKSRGYLFRMGDHGELLCELLLLIQCELRLLDVIDLELQIIHKFLTVFTAQKLLKFVLQLGKLHEFAGIGSKFICLIQVDEAVQIIHMSGIVQEVLIVMLTMNVQQLSSDFFQYAHQNTLAVDAGIVSAAYKAFSG